jgi:hypothetical protein
MRNKVRILGITIVTVSAVIMASSLIGQTVRPLATDFITNRVELNSEIVTVSKPRLVAASISLRCGGDIYQVSTGTNGGQCTVQKRADGSVQSITCTDGANAASASCTDKGVGACDGAFGAGGCTIK